MKIEYPKEETIQDQLEVILNAAMPRRLTFREKIREIYWEPGIHIIFYQCGAPWLITGMVYLLVIASCVLFAPPRAESRLFFPFLCCPLLYLVFSFTALYSEEQTAIIELKQTLKCSFSRMVSLRMFYSGLAAMLLEIVLLCVLRLHPKLNGYAPQRLWSAGASGISSMFLFALCSLYLYHRIKSSFCLALLMIVWIFLCTGIYLAGERISHIMFEDVPIAVHLAAAICCLAAFLKYMAVQSLGKQAA